MNKPAFVTQYWWNRSLKFKELRSDGKTLKQIGDVFGISGERVRQVLNKHARIVDEYHII